MDAPLLSPSTDNMDSTAEAIRKEEPSSDDYDFCINCNSVLLLESNKVSKIFRNASLKPLSPGNLCIKQNEVCQNDEGQAGITEVSLATAISVIFNFHDNEDGDEWPVAQEKDDWFLCGKCGKLLELTYNALVDFTELTRRGSVLQEKLKRLKSREKQVLSEKTELLATSSLTKEETDPMLTDMSPQLFQTEESEKQVFRERKRMLKESMEKSKITKRCGSCSKSLASETLLDKHKNLFHSNNARQKNSGRKSLRRQKRLESVGTEDVLPKSDVTLYYCTHCDMEFEDVDRFENHLKTHEEDLDNENNACQLTGIKTEKYIVGGDADDDDGDEDLAPEKFKCKLCGESNSSTVTELKEHYKNEHSMISILTMSEIDNYEGLSSGATSNEVESTRENKNFNSRVAPSNGRFIFNCNVCKKRFARPDHIKLHLRIHTGEKPYLCNVDGCGKAFSDPRGLAYHEITHSNDRPYCCKFCGMTFKRLHHVRDHEKNHTDVARRFTCQFCNKAFKHRKHLNSHAVIHQGTKEHQCALCFKAFNRKDNLRQHIKKVHANKQAASTTDTSNEIEDGHNTKPTKEIRGKSTNKGQAKLGDIHDVTTTTAQTLVFHPASGTFTTATLVASTNVSNNVIIPQVATSTSSSSSTSLVSPSAEVVKGSIHSAAAASATSAASFPVAITITDPAALDQIVYMHL